MRRFVLSVLAVLVVSGFGCSTGGLHGEVFSGRGFAFRIASVPPSWKVINVSHAALAFRDQTAEGTVLINARCGVDGEDIPLSALTQHLFIRFTERNILDQAVVPFDGREAMRTKMVAKLDGVPMQFDVWVLKKDGCVYDLDYLAPPSRFAEGAARFEQFARGFSALTKDSND